MIFSRISTALAVSGALIAFGAQSSAETLAPAGLGTSFSNQQPSVGLAPYVRIAGPFNDIGEIRWMASTFTFNSASNWAPADGRLLNIASNTAAFSKLGTTYGGDGRTTFAMPNLVGKAVMGVGTGPGLTPRQLGQQVGSDTTTLTVNQMPAHTHHLPGHPANGQTTTSAGGGQAVNNVQESLVLNYEIKQFGTFPSRAALAPGGTIEAVTDSPMAFVRANASTVSPNTNYRDANGDIVPITSNVALFSLLGTTYGGDGRTTFGMPDTRGRIITGAGSGPGNITRQLGQLSGSETYTLTEQQMPSHVHGSSVGDTDPTGGGQSFDNRQPELSLNYIIALQGIFPSFSGNPFADGDEPTLGEVSIFAGNFAPRGWAFAHGQLLSISQFSALFSILGTTFGGDGRTTFALPDLRGATAIGAFTGSVGAESGSDMVTLSTANLPTHTHAAVIPLPATLPLLAGAVLGFGLLRRRRKISA